MAVKHLKYFLEGRKFKIVTDQRSLTHAILSKSDNLSPRQSRYIDFIAQYSTDIVLYLVPLTLSPIVSAERNAIPCLNQFHLFR